MCSEKSQKNNVFQSCIFLSDTNTYTHTRKPVARFFTFFILMGFSYLPKAVTNSENNKIILLDI